MALVQIHALEGQTIQYYHDEANRVTILYSRHAASIHYALMATGCRRMCCIKQLQHTIYTSMILHNSLVAKYRGYERLSTTPNNQTGRSHFLNKERFI